MSEILGRPTVCTEQLTKEICDTIATVGKSLRTLCKENPHWPPRETILRWRRDNDSFRYQYDLAKREQVNAMVDEILEISDDSTHDTITKTNKNGEEYEVANSEWVQRSRLRVDTRKWYAAKLAPKIYGDLGNKDDKEKEDLMSKLIDKLKKD